MPASCIGKKCGKVAVLIASAISHTCLPCPPSGRVSPTCVLCSLVIALMRNDGSFDVLLHGQYSFSTVGSCCFEFTHNKNLLSVLFYFIIIFPLKYPVYSDFFR